MKQQIFAVTRKLLKPYTLASLSEQAAPVVDVPTAHGPIHFRCRGPKAWWRANTALTKERGTLAWIDSFSAGSTLCDVGANIGVYSLYAAKRGIRALAFEPQPLSYANLVENAAMTTGVMAFPIGFGASTKVEIIRTDTLSPGVADIGASHLGHIEVPIVMYTMDDFAKFSGVASPDYVKVDVDGIEMEVLRGALATMASIRELQVELDVSDMHAATEMLAPTGLRPYVIDARAEHLEEKARHLVSNNQVSLGSRLPADIPFAAHQGRLGFNVRFRRAG